MYLFYKRLLDISVAMILICLLSPVFILTMIGLRLSGEGEVFYFQERVGFKNRIFKIWKFATMLKNSPNMGSKDVTLRNDPRVLPLGKYLRATKMNEIPQLFNLLIGDMTLVGPRPLMKDGFERYDPYYKQRIYDVRPGITGVGSIFFRDEELIITRSRLSPHECYEKIILPYKGALEIWYQENRGAWIDLKIIFLTAWVILFPKSCLPRRLLGGLPYFNLMELEQKALVSKTEPDQIAHSQSYS